MDALLGSQYQEMLERYPNIQIQYTTLTSYLYYYDDTGTKPFYMETITNGGNGRYWGSPSKTSTAQYSYSFIGWSKTQGGTVDPNARAAVVFDRNVYAAFKATVRKYMVRFYNGTTLLQTVNDVPYGSSATYTGETPVDPDYNMPFEGWNPSPENIKGHTDCKAVFVSAYELAEISDSWEDILAHIDDGTYRDRYKVGNYKTLDVDSEGMLQMQIVALDKDTLADGSGTAPLSFVSMELMSTKRKMNTNWRQTDPDDSSKYVECTGSVGGWEKCAMRGKLVEEVLPLVPAPVAGRICAVSKTQPYYDTAGTFLQGQVTEDKIWLPSKGEIRGMYKYAFPTATDLAKSIVGQTDKVNWWLRSSLDLGSVASYFTLSKMWCTTGS